MELLKKTKFKGTGNQEAFKLSLHEVFLDYNQRDG